MLPPAEEGGVKNGTCRKHATMTASSAREGRVEQQDVERIARMVLKELGVAPVAITVVPVAGAADSYEVEFGGSATLKIKCGRGSSAQWIRDQIFEQYQAQM